MCCFKKYLTFTVAFFWHIQTLLLLVPVNVNGISRISTTEDSNEDEVPKPVVNALTTSTATKNPLKIMKESQSKFQRAASHEMYQKASECESFVFNEPQGHIFHSPGWPNPYPNNTNCTRILEAPPGFLLRLDFRDSFFIEPSDECKFDFLEIRDGAHGFSNKIGIFCGSNFPPMITSKDRHLWLHFHSDDNIEYGGFTAIYEYIPRPTASIFDEEACRIEVRDRFEGFVNRTDVPESRVETVQLYKLALDCMWTITVEEDWRIQLSFENFKLETPNDCEKNFIDIFDGQTDIPSRIKNLCGSVPDSAISSKNVLHIRFYAEASAVKSTFSILFTAFRDKGPKACLDDEYDCEDEKCIKQELKCNDRINCQFRWDEDNCKIVEQTQSDHVTIIIVVFGLILGGMMVTFFANCIRKIIKDQKLIREHIRQSRESELDAIDRRELKKSLQNLDRINGKSSLKSVEFHELGAYQRQESNKQAEEPVEQEKHYDEPPLHNEEIIINHQSHQIYSMQTETKMCDSSVQTRESLFQNVHRIKTPNTYKVASHPEPRLSSFGYPPPSTVVKVSTQAIQTTEPSSWNEPKTQHQHHSHTRDRYPIERYPSSYLSQHEGERKSAPDVIIVTNSISTSKR